MSAVASQVEGHVSRGFETVRDAFAENLDRRHELGGACAVYHHGEKVVDLWGTSISVSPRRFRTHVSPHWRCPDG